MQEFIPNTNAQALEKCLLRLAAGDTAALEELYHRTSAAVYGFALSILRNAQDAEDALHDCYVSVSAAAGEYRPHGKPMAYLMTLTRNLCLMKLRQRKKTADYPGEDWEQALPAKPGFSPEDRLLLAQCMSELTAEERQIITLHAVAGFKHREIAAFLSLPLPTVLSKYNRGLKKLKNTLLKGEST